MEMAIPIFWILAHELGQQRNKADSIQRYTLFLNMESWSHIDIIGLGSGWLGRLDFAAGGEGGQRRVRAVVAVSASSVNRHIDQDVSVEVRLQSERSSQFLSQVHSAGKLLTCTPGTFSCQTVHPLPGYSPKGYLLYISSLCRGSRIGCCSAGWKAVGGRCTLGRRGCWDCHHHEEEASERHCRGPVGAPSWVKASQGYQHGLVPLIHGPSWYSLLVPQRASCCVSRVLCKLSRW